VDRATLQDNRKVLHFLGPRHTHVEEKQALRNRYP